MVHAYFVLAFVLLWVFLLSFLYLVFTVVRKIDRGDVDGPRDYGL